MGAILVDNIDPSRLDSRDQNLTGWDLRSTMVLLPTTPGPLDDDRLISYSQWKPDEVGNQPRLSHPSVQAFLLSRSVIRVWSIYFHLCLMLMLTRRLLQTFTGSLIGPQPQKKRAVRHPKPGMQMETRRTQSR